MDASHLEFGCSCISFFWRPVAYLATLELKIVLTHELNERKRVGVCGSASQELIELERERER